VRKRTWSLNEREKPNERGKGRGNEPIGRERECIEEKRREEGRKERHYRASDPGQVSVQPVWVGTSVGK
jgi:hypothetical protein